MSEHDLLGENCDDPFCAHALSTLHASSLSDEERAWRAQHPRPRVGPRHRVRRARWTPPVESPAVRTAPLTLDQLEALTSRSSRTSR